MKKHGRLPIWVAIEIWDFGALSRLFAGMNIKDQDAIAASYGLGTGRELEQWLRSLSYLRNVAAHHSRMWNVNVLELSPAPQFDQNWQSLANARPFMYFCIMRFLLARISPNSSWGERFKALMAEFPNLPTRPLRPPISGWCKVGRDGRFGHRRLAQKKTGTYTFLCRGAGHIVSRYTHAGRFVNERHPWRSIQATRAGGNLAPI
jgi:hypothetical protein